LLWFFCFFPRVKLRPFKRVPLFLTVAVVALTVFLRIWNPDFVDRLEKVVYDARVRAAANIGSTTATNLGFVFIDEYSIQAVAGGDFGYHFGLYWPRQVYGRVVEELASQGAKLVAFDVIFGELRRDHPLAQLPSGDLVESDEFLAIQMQRASNVVLAVTPDITLPELFRTNAAHLADITTERDSDGVLRRVRAFRDYREWHPLFRAAAAQADWGIQLEDARLDSHRIILPAAEGNEVLIQLDANGEFNVADFLGDELPEGMAPTAKPFTVRRVWHMGVVMAASALGLDLASADVDLNRGRIVLKGDNGISRTISVDGSGHFLIDWRLKPNDPRITIQPIHDLLRREHDRTQGKATQIPALWKDKVIVVGSAVAGGNDLTDRGATPLESDTLLVSKHWNVANSIITGTFVRRFSTFEECLLITLLGGITAFITCRLRALASSLAIVALLVGYVTVSFWMYAQSRVWLPVVLLCGGAMLVNWACLTAWRVVFEQTEQRRVKSVFSRIVSPNIVKELLGQQTLALGGTRREVTVYFADVRGFTEFTDVSHQHAAEHVRTHNLTDSEASAYIDQQAREALDTVNLYLSCVADMVKQHDGTLDKYIGDCVMAFWGAPTPNLHHAGDCVRAAIGAQQAVAALNAARTERNKRIDAENQQCAATGHPVKPLLPLLELGAGIHTGMVTVGLMGSDAHLFNYTVFGRDVNVASRLEAISGRGRIIISEATFIRLQRDNPTLAAACVEMPPVDIKGIRESIRIYEVPWRLR
jgi:class 3 adenylate cyclase/CHASE2 domain-containing sensor protein